MDCLIDKDGNITMHPDTIAHIIHSTQEKSFHKQATLCSVLIDHPHDYMCAICQYPWLTKGGFILKKRNPSQLPPLGSSFTIIIYNLYFKNLSNEKAPGLDGIPNKILKTLPNTFHDMLYLFFLQCYHQKATPEHKIITILLHKQKKNMQ